MTAEYVLSRHNRPIGLPCYRQPLLFAATIRCPHCNAQRKMMPKKKREPTGASTPRARKCRAKKRLRSLLKSYDGMFGLDLQTFYRAQGLPVNIWVSAQEFASGYLPQTQQAILQYEFSGVESATAKIDGKFIRLIRPNFLGENV